MTERMIANGVPLDCDGVDQLGMRCGLLAGHKESGLNAMGVEHPEQFRGGQRIGAVIKGQR
ncbi:MAG: hypothetical protein MUP74_01960, partial [Desulfobacterales bacterium]|nr:hypothetical protein [Desulfobacterales bacterium]